MPISIFLIEQSLMMNSFQCMNDPLWIFNSFDIEQCLISNVPSTEEENESSPISIVSSSRSPCNFKSFTFFKEPLPTCNSLRLRNLVKSRVTNSSSLQLFAAIVKRSTPSRSPLNSSMLWTTSEDETHHITLHMTIIRFSNMNSVITSSTGHLSLFLSQTLFEEMMKSYTTWQV